MESSHPRRPVHFWVSPCFGTIYLAFYFVYDKFVSSKHSTTHPFDIGGQVTSRTDLMKDFVWVAALMCALLLTNLCLFLVKKLRDAIWRKVFKVFQEEEIELAQTGCRAIHDNKRISLFY